MQKNFFDPYLLSNLQDKVHTALRNHNKIRLGEDLLVRVPAKFPGVRIIKDDEGAKVEYIYQQWYDPESKQSRNKKATIGRIRYEFPEAMIANDNYEKYFDLETGKPLNPLREPEPEEEITPKRQPKASQHKSQSTTKQHTPTKPRTEWTEEEDEEEKRKEAEKRKREEELNANMEKALREIRENAAERRRKEREEKLRGEEEERRKELFADMAIAESIEADNARNDLDDLLRRIAADEPEQTKKEENTREANQSSQNEEDKEEKEEQPNHKKEAEPNNKEENPNNTNETESMKETDEREDENDRDDEEDLQQAYDEYLASQERIAVLYHIILGIQKTLQVHARKKPDEIINEYKARTINHILEEVRSRYEGTDYLDLLTLIEEPREEEQNGKTIHTGMTYSDAEVLLEHYTNILRFIKNAATRPE